MLLNHEVQSMQNSSLLPTRLKAAASEIEGLLNRLLSAAVFEDEVVRPRRLLEAMRYASLGGGKRVRPFLVIEVGTLFGAARDHALMVGAAVECVHAFSLVHDDMPALDDGDERRGQPTVHKCFDEATALLAGDSLLTFAFDLLSRPETHPDPGVRIALVASLARAVGVGGMVGGEMLDIASEGRFGTTGPLPLNEGEVTTLQIMKTGSLIRFACGAGAILGNATPAARGAIARYGQAIGEAFQIKDDLLDLEGDQNVIGKPVGKDGLKATFPRLFGAGRARDKIEALVARANTELDTLGVDTGMLRAVARFIVDRSN
jgi:farnesyl diphosphate synthase